MIKKSSEKPTREWYPHVTIATTIEHNGQFLLVEEISGGHKVFNQPAGHLEPNESIIEASIRESKEETGWHVQPTHFLGISVYEAPSNGTTYVRISLKGTALSQITGARLDDDIIATHWLTYEEIKVLHQQNKLRSPMVWTDIDKHQSGNFQGLDLLEYIPLK